MSCVYVHVCMHIIKSGSETERKKREGERDELCVCACMLL